MLKKQIIKYKFEKYVLKPDYFCNLDWWYAKEAFMPVCLKNYKNKYGVKAPKINSMFNAYTIHFWRDRVTKKFNLDLDKVYDKNSLWEVMITKLNL